VKITKSQLKQIIKEELTQAGDWSDDKDRPWDPELKAISNAYADIALGAIDYYNYETQEDAREGITRELQAAFDNFVEGGGRPDLNQILDEEFGSLEFASDPDQPRPDEERYLRNAPRGEDPLVLPRPTQDPMGRGPETSDLRRRAMRRK